MYVSSKLPNTGHRPAVRTITELLHHYEKFSGFSWKSQEKMEFLRKNIDYPVHKPYSWYISFLVFESVTTAWIFSLLPEVSLFRMVPVSSSFFSSCFSVKFHPAGQDFLRTGFPFSEGIQRIGQEIAARQDAAAKQDQGIGFWDVKNWH